MRVEEMDMAGRVSGVTVWGCAAGRRTTEGAARGAFTCRHYATADHNQWRNDWMEIITVVPWQGPKHEATAIP